MIKYIIGFETLRRMSWRRRVTRSTENATLIGEYNGGAFVITAQADLSLRLGT
jgi:hypothetical protein